MIRTSVRYRCGHKVIFETERITYSSAYVVRDLRTMICPDCAPRVGVDADYARLLDRQAVASGSSEVR